MAANDRVSAVRFDFKVYFRKATSAPYSTASSHGRIASPPPYDRRVLGLAEISSSAAATQSAMLEIGFGGGRTNPRLPDRPVHLTGMAGRKRWSVSPQTRSISGRHLKPTWMRRVAFSRHVAGHHRICAEGRYDRTRNMPTDIFTLRAENAPMSAIRKSQFSEVHVARADTTSRSAVAVAIPSYPSIQSGVLLRPGVSAAGCCAPGPYK